ncbi:MAG: 5-oxoprolinase subunit PxpB, partial [Treponema sp.]|nr:5-oxoprolinase subunit PxpB [Treponema sp.]
MEEVKIVAASEDSIQIQFEQKICPKVNHQISAFCRAFELFTKDMPQIREIVPTYCSVSIYFDETNCKAELITHIAEEVLDKMEWADGEYAAKSSFQEPADSSFVAGKIIRIPVCYDDQEFAPDLKIVCDHAKLTKDEVIKLHSSIDYLIYMMGFLPGFPYLGGMDERLETPRLQTPRTKIPAGSVAIGGEQTGLYPVESPGGWNIIGRTPLKVFDLNRAPKFLYKAGDKIRFVPISRAEFDTFDEEKWLNYELTGPQDGQKSRGVSTNSTTAIRTSKTNVISNAAAKPS